MDKLMAMARKISEVLGLPKETKFYRTNPVQIFDFSSRARARSPAKYLTTESTRDNATVLTELPESTFALDSKPLAERAHIAPIFPVGDALLVSPEEQLHLSLAKPFEGAILAARTWVKQRVSWLLRRGPLHLNAGTTWVQATSYGTRHGIQQHACHCMADTKVCVKPVQLLDDGPCN